jgi:hypothetical protein
MLYVLTAGAPAAIAVSHRTVMQERIHPLVGHRHWPGESLLHVDAHLGLILHRDADLYPLAGSGLPFWMQ